jgi:hypothetical protein
VMKSPAPEKKRGFLFVGIDRSHRPFCHRATTNPA